MRTEDDRWLDHLEYSCVEADLLSLQVDAVAIPVNISLNLNYTLGRLLAQRGGQALEERVLAAARRLPGGRLTLGTATSILTDDLPHLPKRVILVAWWNKTTAYHDQHIYKCYASALREAFQHKAASLGLPILGGGGGVSAQRRARVICTLLQQFNQLKKSGSFSVNELVFADLVREPLDAIESELNQKLYGP